MLYQLLKEIQRERRTIFVLAMAVFLILQGVSAPAWSWTGPSAAPPRNNIPVPIFGSFGSQTRSGPLTINGLLSIGSNLVVGGAANFNVTQINGVLTMNSFANVCKMVRYLVAEGGTGRTSCGAHHYAVGVTDNSFVLQNPESPPQEGYLICCKNND